MIILRVLLLIIQLKNIYFHQHSCLIICFTIIVNLFNHYHKLWGRRMIKISTSLIWSITLVELIFSPCGEFRWSPEGIVSQIHSPHLHVGASRIFSDLLRSVQMLKREWSLENNGELPHLFIPSKMATLVPGFVLWTELIPLFLSLRWKSCPWAELSDDDDDDDHHHHHHHHKLYDETFAVPLGMT